MKLIGLMPIRDEDWIVGLSLRVALLWCDEVVVFLHACTDGTQQIVWDVEKEYPGRVVSMSSSIVEWYEMVQRQTMLDRARERGATHIAIIDADEVLSGNMLDKPYDEAASFRSEVVHGTPPGHILQLPLYNLRGGIHRYHSNGIWGNRIVSLAFADDPRLGWSGDKFHSREPEPRPKPYQPIGQGRGGVMHLWGASERRLRARHALYKVTERLRWPDKQVADIDRMYSWAIKGDAQKPEYGTPDTWTYADVPREWWEPYEKRGWLQYLHLDREPWQIAEVRRLVAEHGAGKFAGLDFFGVA